MEWTYISDDYAVSAQIQVADIPEIVAEGFKSVINNRPDGEDSGQPLSAVIQAALEEAGLKTAYNPVNPTGLTPDNLEAIRDHIASLPKPILAFCRTGNRSTILYKNI